MVCSPIPNGILISLAGGISHLRAFQQAAMAIRRAMAERITANTLNCRVRGISLGFLHGYVVIGYASQNLARRILEFITLHFFGMNDHLILASG